MVQGLSQGGPRGELGCLLGSGSSQRGSLGLRGSVTQAAESPCVKPARHPFREQLLSLSPWEFPSQTHMYFICFPCPSSRAVELVALFGKEERKPAMSSVFEKLAMFLLHPLNLLP